MNKYKKLVPVFAGLLLFPGTQLYALDGTKKASNLIGSSSTTTFENISTAKMQTMYLLSDANIFTTNSTVSAVKETQASGTQVSIISVDGDMCQVLTQTGNIGYVSIDLLTSQKEYVFLAENVTMYADTDTELKASPFDSAAAAVTLDLNTALQLTGSNEMQYWRVVYNGTVYYVNKDQLNTKKTYSNTITYMISWNGTSLNPANGSVMGPSGKETYYNLDMSGVVNIMRGLGDTDEYWVRADGVKMLGQYVIVAANLSLRPRGTLVQTSVGIGIVCDTGGFALNNPTQLDIAVAW